MTQTLLPKLVVTTFLFVVFMCGAAHAQSATTASAVPAAPAQVVTTVPPPQGVTAPAAPRQNTEDALVLLSRIQTIVEEAMSDKPRTRAERPLGTSGTLGKAGQVMVDRADLDEIRAEVDQLKTVLQTYKPPQSVQPVLPTQ
jgi:hypothetical protein